MNVKGIQYVTVIEVDERMDITFLLKYFVILHVSLCAVLVRCFSFEEFHLAAGVTLEMKFTHLLDIIRTC
jgi:hypothetical protein